MRARAQAAQGKPTSMKIQEVEVSDLKLSALGRLEKSHQINHIFIVKIEADRSPVRLRDLRLLFDRNHFIILPNSTSRTLRIFNPEEKIVAPSGRGWRGEARQATRVRRECYRQELDTTDGRGQTPRR